MADFRLLPMALEELEAAVSWYRTKSLATADRFVAVVEAALKRIEKSPHSHPKWDNTHRYLLLDRFPYFIAYRIIGDYPLIVAIRHTAQDDPRLDER